MIRSLMIAKTGLDAQQTQLDVISNNLANVSTAGFKRSRAVFEDLLYQTVRQPGAQSSQQTQLPTGLQLGTGVRPVATERVFTQGNLQQTGNALDVAINGQGFFQVLLPDRFLVAAGRQDRAFVDQVLQIGADKTRCAARQGSQVDTGLQGLALDVHFQDRLASLHIRAVEGHTAVETTGTQQGRIQDVGAVGGSNDDDVGVGIETVHLDQHLVQGLLALIV